LVIDQQYYIIDGHHRYDALSELGFESARVLLVDAPIEEVVDEFQQYRDNTPTIEEVLVEGTRATLQSAVDKQMAADNLISVVDSDALGNFPDTTAAEAIRRLSGISVENDQGEGRYVTIRGLSSDLNSVAINGASMVAPEKGRTTNRTVRQYHSC
jgi:outer membrane receptor for ferrienterochelin and colicin